MQRIAADMNPGSDSLHQVNVRSTVEEQRLINSPNHGREGQNVLYGDGHVEFFLSPFAGVNRDNIYTFGPSGANYADSPGDGIVGPSMLAQDSILLPPAADIAAADQFGDLKPPPPAPQDDDD
jgi:prepilin-type processing-associated H-X9-DG protein